MNGHGRLLVLLGTLATAASLTAAAARADLSPLQPLDPCAIAPAQATLTLPTGLLVSSASGDTSWSQSFCGRYVVDVKVAAGSGTFSVAGGASGYPSEPVCNALTESVTVYRAGGGTGFTRVASGTFTGHYDVVNAEPLFTSGACILTQISGDPATKTVGTWAAFTGTLSPSLLGAATYRIAVSARIATIFGQLPLPVSALAGWNWPPVPK